MQVLQKSLLTNLEPPIIDHYFPNEEILNTNKAQGHHVALLPTAKLDTNECDLNCGQLHMCMCLEYQKGHAKHNLLKSCQYHLYTYAFCTKELHFKRRLTAHFGLYFVLYHAENSE